MYHFIFQVTSTTPESDDDCVIVDELQGRLVYSHNKSIDNEVDPTLGAFGVLIGNVKRPDPNPPKVKVEQTSDDDKEDKEGEAGSRPVATKKRLLSHDRHGNPIDKVVSCCFLLFSIQTLLCQFWVLAPLFIPLKTLSLLPFRSPHNCQPT